MLDFAACTTKGIYVTTTLQLMGEVYHRVPVMEVDHGRWYWVTDSKMYFRAYARDSDSFWLTPAAQPGLWEVVTGRFFVGSFPDSN